MREIEISQLLDQHGVVADKIVIEKRVVMVVSEVSYSF